MRRVIASTVSCPDRTVWVEVGEDLWRCDCCGMRVNENDLVEPFDVAL